MNFLLLAADEVGLQTVKVFQRHRQPIKALVLDHQDRKGLNTELRALSNVPPDNIFLAEDLQASETLAKLAAMRLDLGILAWWPYILRRPVLDLARLGCLNFHPSFLPHNRGKDPNFWALKDQTPCGVTIHFVDEGVDTGDIAFQDMIPTSWEENGGTLYIKAAQAMVDLFDRSFDQIRKGDIPRKRQDGYGVRQHKRSQLEPASEIDLDASYRGRDLLNLLRARTFPPHPGAWFVEGEERYEVQVTIRRVSRQ